MTKTIITRKVEYQTTRTEREYMDGIRQHKLERGRVIAAETDGQINRRIANVVDSGALDHLAPAQRDCCIIEMRNRESKHAERWDGMN